MPPTLDFLKDLSDIDRIGLREALASLEEILSVKEAARPDMGKPGDPLSPKQMEAVKTAVYGVALGEWVSEFQSRLAQTFSRANDREREQVFNRVQRILQDQDLTELSGLKIEGDGDALDVRAKLTSAGTATLTQLRRPIVSDKPHPAQAHIAAGQGVLFSIVVAALILGVCFIGAGIWLVYLGATGATQITIFGNTVHSENVGIASIFCGAIVVAVTFRSVMQTLVDLGKI